MLHTLKGLAKIDSDGFLHIQLPADSANTEIEFVLVWRNIPEEQVDAKGWPIGFFERTYGSMADNPMDEIKQLPPEERDEID